DRWLRPETASGRSYTYRLEPGRGLDGISDHGPATLPYRTRRRDGAGHGHATFWLGTTEPAFAGGRLRASRIGDPGPLVITFGTTPGQADLGVAPLEASTIHPVWDLWYEARIPRIELEPGRIYHMTVRAEVGLAPTDGYVLYG